MEFHARKLKDGAIRITSGHRTVGMLKPKQAREVEIDQLMRRIENGNPLGGQS